MANFLTWISIILCFSTCNCVIQQLILHESVEEDGNYYVFKSPVADLDSHKLGNLTRFCYQGLWAVFAASNFRSLELYDGDTFYAENLTCKNMSVWFKSFRFGGSRDTEKDAISLFSQTSFGEEEIFFDEIAVGGLKQFTQSVIWTGDSSWTIFEGENFSGNRSCLEPPPNGFNGYPYLQTNLGLANVGSIVKVNRS